ncbi:MAG: ferritin family protein [Firmicutes bacterium]|jgi:rubrerythrin|nr:ferritin family protein [Bacillota bacterium]
MDIYEFAMDIEKKGKEHYLLMMEEAQNKGLKKIFKFLADEEEKHYRYIEAIKNKVKIELESDNLENAERVFELLISEENKNYSGVKDQIQAYQKAGEFEDKSIEFYKEQLNKHKDPLEKNIFLRLYFEEKKHKLLIENILEFVTEFEMEASSPEHLR